MSSPDDIVPKRGSRCGRRDPRLFLEGGHTKWILIWLGVPTHFISTLHDFYFLSVEVKGIEAAKRSNLRAFVAGLTKNDLAP